MVKRSEEREIRKLQIILKTAERCNLACPYCYYFFSGDESYKDRPGVIGERVRDQLVDRLEEAVEQMGLTRLSVAFHGGEPMLQKVEAFNALASALRTRLDPQVKLGMSIQTNGTLFTGEWIDALVKNRVGVGISIDGPQDHHDAWRPDHKGRGSYAKIVEGISLWQERSGKPLGSISVISPELNYKEVCEHLHNELGFAHVNFLLPDRSRAGPPLTAAEERGFTAALCDIFDFFMEHESLGLSAAESVLDFFAMGNNQVHRPGYFRVEDGRNLVNNQILVVHSDGTMSVDDTFMPTTDWHANLPKSSLFESSIRDYIDTEVFEAIDAIHETLPAKCQACDLVAVCRGGPIEYRHDADGSFDNASVYCGVFEGYYRHIIERLIEGGYPPERVIAKLGLEEERAEEAVK